MRLRVLLLVIITLGMAACSKYGCNMEGQLVFTAFCNDGLNDTQILHVEHLTDKDIERFVAKYDPKLCSLHGGVFKLTKPYVF